MDEHDPAEIAQANAEYLACSAAWRATMGGLDQVKIALF